MSSDASNGNGHPQLTPPAFVRTVTLESLRLEVDELQAREANDYRDLRDAFDRLREDGKQIRYLHLKVDTNHLIFLDAVGQLARMMGGTFKPLVLPAPKLEDLP